MDIKNSHDSLCEGDPVEVIARFTNAWVGGFEVASVGAYDCRVRRVYDGEILPVAFAHHEVRPASATGDAGGEGSSGSRCVLRLPVELDIATVEAIRASVMEAVDAADGEVVLDLDDVQFLDTYGIRLLVTVRRRAWERDLPFSLRGGKPLVRALLDFVGQDAYFHPNDSEDAGRAHHAASQ